jgi:hypothetical protein
MLMRLTTIMALIALCCAAGCRNGGGRSDGDGDSDADGDGDADADSDADADAGADADPDPDPDADLDADEAPPPGAGVFLYTGAGGGGPGTDLFVDAVEALLSGGGVETLVGDALPAGFADDYGVLVLMNPMDSIPSGVGDAAQELLDRGGRVVIVMEHCKNGCWGNAEADNALIERLGGTMVLSGEGGATLEMTSLVVTPVPPLTDGVGEIVVYYSGSVDAGDGVALGVVDGGDAVVGYEALGAGDLVVVADSSMFGYVMDAGDNERFVLNLARLVD